MELSKGTVFFVLLLAALVGLGLQLYLDTDVNLKGKQFAVRIESNVIDKILNRQKVKIGSDYKGYRNHCLRVMNYALLFLDADLQKKYENATATAIAYHDIGLWTDKVCRFLMLPLSFTWDSPCPSYRRSRISTPVGNSPRQN